MSPTRVTLTFGFAKINHPEQRASLKDKGKGLEKAGHIFNVREHRVEGKPTEITAHILRTTSVNNPPYCVVLTLDENRTVTSPSCSCQAGFDGKCKHVSAVVEFVNSERHEGQTDELGTWYAPSSRGKALYPKGK